MAEEPTDTTSIHVRRALDGSQDDLDWVVARFSPLLLAQAGYRLGRDLARQIDVEDAVSEVWLVALRRRADIQPGIGNSTPTMLAFLSTTLFHVINHRLRNLARRPRVTQEPQSTTGGRDGLDALQAADVTSALTRASRGEVSGAIASSLASLPESDQAVIILRGIEGLSNDEAAAELGERSNTVAQRYRRAIQRLRTVMPRSVFDEFVDV